MPEKTRPRWRRLLLIQLVLWPALLLGAELAYRGVLRARGEPYANWRVERELRRIETSMTRGVPEVENEDGAGSPQVAPPSESVLHPFTGYQPIEFLKNWRQHKQLLGDDRNFVILVVGGSVAGQFSNGAGKTLARQLAMSGAVDGDRFVHVLNHAVGGFKAPQQAALLVNLLSQGQVPDAVVNIDGFNEVAIGLYNARKGVHPSYPSLQHWTNAGSATRPDAAGSVDHLRAMSRDVQSFVRTARKLKLPKSAIAGMWAQRRVHQRWNAFIAAGGEYEANMLENVPPELLGPRFRAEDSVAIEQLVSVWSNHSRTLWKLCRAQGIPYVHYLQPTLHDEGSKPLTEDEVATGAADPAWIEGVHLGYPRLRAAGVLLAADGIAFVDGSDLFQDVTETLYFDSCHFVADGALMMVPAILTALTEQL